MRIETATLFLVLFFAVSAQARDMCESVKVIDGDTIVCVNEGKKTRIRLYGIDAPEKRQAYGNRARKELAAMLEGRQTSYDKLGGDRYGRTVALVFSNDKNVNFEMVKTGYAWVYPQFCKKAFCNDWKKAEKAAKQARRGLWMEQAIPPWEWRGKIDKFCLHAK